MVRGKKGQFSPLPSLSPPLWIFRTSRMALAARRGSRASLPASSSQAWLRREQHGRRDGWTHGARVPRRHPGLPNCLTAVPHPRELAAGGRARNSPFSRATAVRPSEEADGATSPWDATGRVKQAPRGAEGASPGPLPARAPHEPHPEWAGACRGNLAPRGRDPGAAGSGALPCWHQAWIIGL